MNLYVTLDVSSVLTGFYNLVSDIQNSGNLVAMNQYAKLFGLTVSDITSVLNLSSEDIGNISKDMASYQETLDQVDRELRISKLWSRSSYSEVIDNIKNNILTSIGLDMATDVGANLMYQVADLAANIVEQFELEASYRPWGIGASITIDPATMIRGNMVTGSYLGAILSNISALSSVLSPNLKLLGGEESSTIKILGGSGTGDPLQDKTENQFSYIGRTDDSAVFNTVSQQANSQSSTLLTKDIDEESKKMEKMSKSMVEVADNVEIIVRLLDTNGIKVRSVGDSLDIGTISKVKNNFFGTSEGV